jgi:hypothetical protein
MGEQSIGIPYLDGTSMAEPSRLQGKTPQPAVKLFGDPELSGGGRAFCTDLIWRPNNRMNFRLQVTSQLAWRLE